MSVAELLHSNLCLLGYEKEALAAKIILSDETFEHANERAFQSVVYFLLRALDEERCRLTFRHCWPVLDKKQSSVFRQAIVAWLKEVKQTDPDGDTLPQINPSLFLSPGGRKFKDLILALTQFVMLKSMQKIDSECPGGELILTRGDPELQCGALRAACALGKERFVQLQQTRLVSHSQHQRFADSFSAQFRRLRQSISSLTLELGRMVAVSDLPPELTHRLLQENADTVVPAVYGAARQHLAALMPALDRLRQFCAETEYTWQVAESIITGAVAESVVDAETLVTPLTAATGQDGTAVQSSSDLMVDGKLDLVTFFDTFVDKVEHLRQFLSHCPVGDLKGLHGTLPPLEREATQLASDAARLLAQLETETEAAGRRLDRLLATAPPPPPRGRSASPPPLLAPRTPNWSLSAALPPPPGDHPLRHLCRSPVTDGRKLELDLELSADAGDPSLSSRFSSLTSVTAGGSARSPWASPAPPPPSMRVTAPSPAGRESRAGDRSATTGRLTPTQGRETPGGDARSGHTALSSCSSLFSPVCGERSGTAGSSRLGSVCGELGSPPLGSVSSLADSLAETARHGGDASRARSGRSPARAATPPSVAAAAVASAPGSPSPQVMRLRERTSVFLRSLTRSREADYDGKRARGAAQMSPRLPLPLDLSMTGGESPAGLGSLRGTEPHQSAWQERRLSRSSPSSPRGSELPRVAWQEETRLAPEPASPLASEVSPPGGRSRRRTRSGPGSVAPLLSPPAVIGLFPATTGLGLFPAAESGVREVDAQSELRDSRQCGAETTSDGEFNFSQLNDKMAEELALTVFGPGDFNHSLDFSNRESLGGVELSLVDSDFDTGPASGRLEPPTDVLIDI